MLKQLQYLLFGNRTNPMTNFYENKYVKSSNDSERQSMLYVYDLMGLHTYQRLKRFYK